MKTRGQAAAIAVVAAMLVGSWNPGQAKAAPVELNIKSRIQLIDFGVNACDDAGNHGLYASSEGRYRLRLRPAGSSAWTQLVSFLREADSCLGATYWLQVVWEDSPFLSTAVQVGDNTVEYMPWSGGLVNNPKTHIVSDLYLEAPHLSAPRLIFSSDHYLLGNAPQKATFNLKLSVADVNPGAGDAIDALKSQMADLDEELASLAQDATDAGQKLARLEEFQVAIDALLAQGFDALTVEALTALLAEYADILDAGTRASLQMLLADFKTDIDDLIAELGAQIDSFRDRLGAAGGILSSQAEMGGFDLSASGNYVDPTSTNNIPDIDAPELVGDDFDAANDPYKRYADNIILQLQATLVGSAVNDRSGFLNIVEGWTANHQALQDALAARGNVSSAEYEAFTAAEHRVLTFVNNFLDVDGWFKDTAVPPRVRAFVDFGLAAYSLSKSRALKTGLNKWKSLLTNEQKAWLDLLLLMDAAWVEIRTVPPEEEKDIWDTFGTVVDGAITLVKIGIEFTPIGDLKDACELLTGWEGCDPAGRTLTTTERLLAGAGLVIGSGAAWRAAGDAVSPVAGVVVKKLADAVDELPPRFPVADVLKKTPVTGGAIDFTKAVDLGDEGIAEVTIRYGRYGFPDFSKYLFKAEPGQRSTVYIVLSGSRPVDERLANLKAGFYTVTESGKKVPKTPEHYTWHHHQEVGKMMLVRKSVHNAFRHNGGVAVWQKITGKTYDD